MKYLLSVDFNGSITIDVIEPPFIYDEQVRQQVLKDIVYGLSRMRLGTTRNLSINANFVEEGTRKDGV